MSEQPIEIQFPVKGVDETWANGRQPDGTSPDLANVRAFDAELRLRGGQRNGFSKYLDDAVNAGEKIQRLADVTTAVDPAEEGLITLIGSETFTQVDGVFVSANWKQYINNYADTYNAGQNTSYVEAQRYIGPARGVGGHRGIIWNTPIELASYRITFGFYCGTGSFPDSNNAQIYVRRAAPPGNNYSSYLVYIVQVAGTNWRGELRSIGPTGVITSGLATATKDLGTASGPVQIVVDVAGDDLTLTIDGVIFWTYDMSTLGNTHQYVGVGIADVQVADTTQYLDNVQIQTIVPPDSLTNATLVVVSGGNIYQGSKSAGLALATDGTAAVSATARVGAQQAYGLCYFVDGTESGYKVLTVATGAVADWNTLTGDLLPVGDDDATLGCKIIALYRGRIVLAGLQEDPHNWFMSRVDDPLDWDYNADPLETTPIAGNNADAGLVGDVITALIPYSDDTLIFGGDHTLYLLRGDPAVGGAIDALSYQVGVSGPDAWAFDSDGTLYFYGTGAVWRVPAGGGLPQNMTDARIRRRMRDIDTRNYNVTLAWNTAQRGLHMFVVPAVEQSTAIEHYYWDKQTDSWWIDTFPTNMGPSAVHNLQTGREDDRGLILGGYDSYLRFDDPTASDDDGTAIGSHVAFGPFVPGGADNKARLTRARITLDEQSDPARFEVHAAATPELALASTTPVFSRMLAAGRSPMLTQRVSGGAFVFRIVNDDAVNLYNWQFESLAARFEGAGRQIHGRT